MPFIALGKPEIRGNRHNKLGRTFVGEEGGWDRAAWRMGEAEEGGFYRQFIGESIYSNSLID